MAKDLIYVKINYTENMTFLNYPKTTTVLETRREMIEIHNTLAKTVRGNFHSKIF